MKTTELTKGLTVYHNMFGKMTVAEIINDEIVSFQIATGEIKKIILKYASLSFSETTFNYTPPKINNTERNIRSEPSHSKGTFIGDYIQQGCSNRHLDARNNDNKVTAGEMAKLLTKELKRKVLAKDIAAYSKEWHHAGVFKKRNGKTGGKRVFWFNISEKESLLKKLQ